MSKSTIAGAAVLLIPAGFVLANVLQYVVGLSLPWNPYESVLNSVSGTPWRYAFDFTILASPMAAFGLLLLPNLRFSRSRVEGELASIVIRKGNTSALALMVGCGLVLGILGAYLLGENMPCILGQQISC